LASSRNVSKKPCEPSLNRNLLRAPSIALAPCDPYDASSQNVDCSTTSGAPEREVTTEENAPSVARPGRSSTLIVVRDFAGSIWSPSEMSPLFSVRRRMLASTAASVGLAIRRSVEKKAPVDPSGTT
jgi:hypothetical protein